MNNVPGIGSFFERELNLIGEYWGRRIGEAASLSGGFSLAMAEVKDELDCAVAGENTVVQSAAGASFGLVKLFAAMPLGLLDWSALVVDAARQTPRDLLTVVFAGPALGMIEGGKFVFSRAKGWLSGGFANQSRFNIASEITEVLGGAVMTASGAVKMARGAVRVTHAGMGPRGRWPKGELSMQEILDSLRDGNRNGNGSYAASARRLGVTPQDISFRVGMSSRVPRILRRKKGEGGGRPPVLDDETLYRKLVTMGSVKRVARRHRITARAIYLRLQYCLADSPLRKLTRKGTIIFASSKGSKRAARR